ncbi:pimeloyl-ACP methyl ester carboxylesterase [Chryseobacterium ginsenosidimutans]|uniref:alpha/beta fold hydrolase n=1 Tax=Chryseobacterium ginsenosidimutans TaxID=687846 RepID=UPI002780927E|nr:alpha/beta hydrolase [Chryseobacterium ginsenosidimutans]MDQ0592321.1 pimeloyl-ACP methyl ester carboxylesterase [Chryseobacterium ginsenosidimutans]
MKNFITISLLLFSVVAFAQSKTIVAGWTSLVQPVNVQNMQNWKFRASAKIRKENDNNSKCAIWARVDNIDDTTGFFENQAYSNIKVTSEWKTFTIEGNINSKARILNIGAFAEDNGDFYFDDFKLEVNDGKTKKWKEISLKNSGFEEDLILEKNWVEGIGRNKITHVKNFSITTSDNQPFSGKKSLLIKGQNIIGNMPHGKFADVNGIKMYYETYGEGEPLLMLHGNGQSISAFMNQVDVFSKKYKVIIVDCRERGKSTYDKTKELTFDIQVEDLKQFLDQQNIKKVKILGWSDGGILAILMALKHPDLVDKIACSGANIFPEGVTDEEFKESKETLARLIKENKDGKNDVYIDLYNLDLKYPNLKYEDLKAIRCPSLIMAGDKDVIKTEHTVKIAESIPKGQLAIIPNSTHSVVVEKPELFNSLVMDFFDDK